jgi:hypothetical protein
MRNRKVTGIFERRGDAEKLKEELLEAGVALHRIVVSDKIVAVVARFAGRPRAHRAPHAGMRRARDPRIANLSATSSSAPVRALEAPLDPSGAATDTIAAATRIASPAI